MARECWLFLDCQVMTGYPPKRCPNYIACLNNAQNSVNRSCSLPYERWLPSNNRYLYVIPFYKHESQSAGWHPAMKIPYEYEKGKLEVGWFQDGVAFYLEDEAVKAGYQIAEDLPYTVMNNPKQLLVKKCVGKAQAKGGWGSPVDLPMRRRKEPDRWEVDFLRCDSSYKEAIAAGWHPPEPIWADEHPF